MSESSPNQTSLTEVAQILGAAASSSTHGSYPYSSSQTGVRGQSRGKPGSRPTYEKQSSNISSGSTRQSYGASSGHYSRAEEERKIAASNGAGTRGSQASIYIRQGQRAGPSTFGDFTGNVKNFQMTEDD